MFHLKKPVDSTVRSRVCAGFVVFILLVSSLGVGVATGATQSTSTPVADCTTITEPGTYHLTRDLLNAEATEPTGIEPGEGVVNACISIQSSDVTFDGAGHTLDGVGPDGLDPENPVFALGVAANTAEGTFTNVSVRNLTTTDWFVGIVYANATGVIGDVNTSGNYNLGIEVVDVDGDVDGAFVIENVTADENPFAGVYLANVGNVTVANVSAADNGVAGINLFVTRDTLLRDNVLRGNDVAGIAVSESTDVYLDGNEVSNTHGNDSLVGFSGGVVLINSTDAVLEDTVLTDNENWSFYANEHSTARGERFAMDGVSVSFDAAHVAIESADVPAAAPQGYASLGSAVNTVATGENASLVLGFEYSDEAVAALDEETLRIWRYEGDWSVLADSTVEPTENVVTATVTEFGVVAPFASVFGEPLVVSTGRGARVVARPADRDADGLYEDVDGNGRLAGRDVVGLARVVNAVRNDRLQLTSDQVLALDFDGDGRLDYHDGTQLARMVARSRR